MKKIFLLSMNVLSLFINTDAQAPTEKTLLWELSGKGLTMPSYLFGTIHLMCPNDLTVPDVVKEKFAATQELFLEIDMDDPRMMQEMMLNMHMKDTSTLEELMGDQYETVSALFQQKTGFPLKMMNTTKPFMLMSMIYPSLLGCTPVSWEGTFQNMAKENGLEIKGLETLQDQINIFDKIPYKVQSDMLVKMLTNIDSSKEQFDEMMDLYKKKDINKLHVLTEKDEDFVAFEGLVVDERNHNWIPVIGEQAKKKPTFFAFGAGHMGGEKGVINLLRRSGFTVKPVFY